LRPLLGEASWPEGHTPLHRRRRSDHFLREPGNGCSAAAST
jgi:hypothetical protein